MNKQIHKYAALQHKKIAEEKDSEMQKEREINKKIALRTVAAQNYFYAGVHAIESIFAVKDLHSYSHKNRHDKIIENPGIISKGLFKIFDSVDRDLRNKVGYRGENGEKYIKLKEFCDLAVGEMEKNE